MVPRMPLLHTERRFFFRERPHNSYKARISKILIYPKSQNCTPIHRTHLELVLQGKAQTTFQALCEALICKSWWRKWVCETAQQQEADAVRQAQRPGFNPWDPHKGGRRKAIHPLTSPRARQPAHSPPHLHLKYKYKKGKRLARLYISNAFRSDCRGLYIVAKETGTHNNQLRVPSW